MGEPMLQARIDAARAPEPETTKAEPVAGTGMT